MLTKKVAAQIHCRLKGFTTPKISTKFLAELKKESDRGAALISGRLLSSNLHQNATILAYLVDTPEKGELLASGFNAPLGTFSSR